MNTRSTYWAGGLGLLILAPALLSQGQVSPRFDSYQRLTNKEISLRLTAPTGFNYRIDTATNLPEWSALTTLAGTNSSLQHTDSAAPYFNQRFYRAAQLSDTNLPGDYLATTNGDAVLHVRNHATLVISWQGKIIYCDPVSPAGPFTSLPKADLLLVTHIHSDHLSASTLGSVKAATAVILAPLNVYNDGSMVSLRSVTGVLTNGMTTNLLGLSVTAVPAYNSYHPKGTGNGYILNLGGKRIYVSGDTEDIAEMRALTNIDVAFLCMNLPYTMSITNAALAVRDFRPRIVYPYHFRNADNTYSDLADFKRRVGQDLGIEVRLRKWY